MKKTGILEFFYSFLRETLRRKHGSRPLKLSSKVISIGSVQAGGAGKTPISILLSKYFLSKKKNLGIVLLGHGGRRSWDNKIFPPGKVLDVEEVGDEAKLVNKELPEAIIAIGKNKNLLCENLSKNGCDVILIEDGYQWASLCIDLNIVVISKNKPSVPFPKGFLREWGSSYCRADCLIAMPNSDYSEANRWAPSIRKFEVILEKSSWLNSSWESTSPPPERLPLAAGIGNSKILEDELRKEGIDCFDLGIPDHAISKKWKNFVVKKARVHGGVILTKKDAVRWNLEGFPCWIRVRELNLPKDFVTFLNKVVDS
tara:strand:- start:1183 stop:2124 length:942 start_codon:yes stop_codon:yes gene_type:complete